MPPPPPPKKSLKPSVVGQQQPCPPSFPPPPLQQQEFKLTPPAVPQHFKPPPTSMHFKPPSLPMQEPPAVIDIPSIVEAPRIPSVLPEAANVLSEVALGITAGPDGQEDTPPVTAKTYNDTFDEEYRRPSLDFDKFIAEESSTLSAQKIKKVHKKLYETTKFISYNCLVMIVGFPFIIVWGLLLGITSFAMNWVYIPLLKLVSWLLNATIPVMGPIRNCCKPVMEVVSIICKR